MKISKKKNNFSVIIIIFFLILEFLILFYIYFFLSLKENLTEQNNLTNKNENNYWLNMQKKNISKNISNVTKMSSGQSGQSGQSRQVGQFDNTEKPAPITDLKILNDKIDKLEDKMKNYPKI